ncbi:MAG: PIG-L family deacetylase [Planctomycetes bacterium]|nr:PIG-L family deacetylase [Planctomycetota bacterium]
MRPIATIASLAAVIAAVAAGGWQASPQPSDSPPPPAEDGKLRVIVFGAHPDDSEIKAGGAAALWAAAGHHVKFVSTTNGDIGHWRMAGGPLAQRRAEEVRKADAILGVTTEVLDIHDGEILPTLENRRTIVRLIRQWRADVVIGPRPCDYHPDHRYTGILIQDAAYMVTVPFFCPDVPPLGKNPVFLYASDRFQRPYPFQADLVIAIDTAIEKKLDAMAVIESQFLEGGCGGHEGLIPPGPDGREQRRAQVRESFRRRFASEAGRFRSRLVETLGEGKGRDVKYAEAFEVCEYGSQPSGELRRALFPGS